MMESVGAPAARSFFEDPRYIVELPFLLRPRPAGEEFIKFEKLKPSFGDSSSKVSNLSKFF